MSNSMECLTDFVNSASRMRAIFYPNMVSEPQVIESFTFSFGCKKEVKREEQPQLTATKSTIDIILPISATFPYDPFFVGVLSRLIKSRLSLSNGTVIRFIFS